MGDSANVFDPRYYNENGELIKTQWDIEAEEEEKRKEKQRRAEERRRNASEINRRMVIDQKKSEFEERREKELQKQKLRDEAMHFPQWLKSMPYPKLDAPPESGGVVSSLAYKLKGEDAISDEEMSRRKALRARKKKAIAQHRSIRRELPYNHRMGHVTVVSLDQNSGSSALVKLLSSTMQDSRAKHESFYGVDFAKAGNDLSQWYKSKVKDAVTLKILINQLRIDPHVDLTPKEVIPVGDINKQEHYINNSHKKNYRIEPEVEDIINFTDFMSKGTGITFYECNVDDGDAFLSLAFISDVVVFVAPSHKQAGVFMAHAVETLKEMYDAEEMEDIVDKSIVVMPGTKPAMATTKGMRAISSASKKVAEIEGIDTSRAFYIPFDKSLVTPPVDWGKVSFPVKNNLRDICSKIVDIIMGENDE